MARHHTVTSDDKRWDNRAKFFGETDGQVEAGSGGARATDQADARPRPRRRIESWRLAQRVPPSMRVAPVAVRPLSYRDSPCVGPPEAGVIGRGRGRGGEQDLCGPVSAVLCDRDHVFEGDGPTPTWMVVMALIPPVRTALSPDHRRYTRLEFETHAGTWSRRRTTVDLPRRALLTPCSTPWSPVSTCTD